MMDILTCTEAAAVLGVNDSRIRQLIAQGRIKAVKFGSGWAIERQALAKFKPMKRGPKPKK